MKGDVSGRIPDPSLGNQPRDEDRAARLLDVPFPACFPGREPRRIASAEAAAPKLTRKNQRSRCDRDIPETHPPRTSCSRCTGFGGDRVHRGEPLLLGVDKEYQITYRP